MKTLFLFIMVTIALGGYLVYSGNIDPQQAKLVIENVDDYAKAVFTSVDTAQEAVETINARNRDTEKKIEESIK